jgi:hypothetical protein
MQVSGSKTYTALYIKGAVLILVSSYLMRSNLLLLDMPIP